MVPLVLLTASLGACSLISKSSTASTRTTTSSTTSKTSSSKASTASTSYFTDRDQDASYDESSATTVSYTHLTLTLALPLSEDAELSSLLEELALDEEDTLELELSFVSLSAEFPQAAKKKSETSVIRDK